MKENVIEKELDKHIKKQKAKLFKLIFALVIGIPAWIILFIMDWKLALLLLIILWSNNLSME